MTGHFCKKQVGKINKRKIYYIGGWLLSKYDLSILLMLTIYSYFGGRKYYCTIGLDVSINKLKWLIQNRNSFQKKGNPHRLLITNTCRQEDNNQSWFWSIIFSSHSDVVLLHNWEMKILFWILLPKAFLFEEIDVRVVLTSNKCKLLFCFLLVKYDVEFLTQNLHQAMFYWF